MNERPPGRSHITSCNSCCGDLFKCGDMITVTFSNGDTFDGIYISSTCGRLIWRNTDAPDDPLECTSCSIISIAERFANTNLNEEEDDEAIRLNQQLSEETSEPDLENVTSEASSTSPANEELSELEPEPNIEPKQPEPNITTDEHTSLLRRIVNFFIKR